MDFDSFYQQQLVAQGMVGCCEALTYEVVEE